MSEKESEMPEPFPPKPVKAASFSSAKSVAQTEAGSHSGAMWRHKKVREENSMKLASRKEKTNRRLSRRFRCQGRAIAIGG
jgi:hypothetical protein